MPKIHSKINDVLQNILKKRYNQDKDLIEGTPESERLSAGTIMKNEIVAEMADELNKLNKKGEITEEQFKNAQTALEFYDKNIKILPFNPNPHSALNELTGIDYSQEVKIMRVKKNRVLTQMQPAYLQNQDGVGNFYAERQLPADFDERANKSGIGVKGRERDNEVSKKSVYMSFVEKECTALKSTASPMLDTWSVNGVQQKSQGGGVQFRMSTDDYGKIVRKDWSEVQERQHGEKDKLLKKGLVTTEQNKPEKVKFSLKLAKREQTKNTLAR